MAKTLALGVILSVVFNSDLHAQDDSVYQCEKNGVIEFSQFPCGNDAKKITVKEQNPGVPSTVVTHGAIDDTGVDDYIRIKQIDAEIVEHQNKIDTFKARMNKETAALENQSDAQLNNLTGAKKDTAIANQMASVSERYNLLIDSEQQYIDRLNNEKNNIIQRSQSSVATSQQSKEIDNFIRLQQIKREISEHQDKIDTYQAQLDDQIKQLEQQAEAQPKNLTDATFDNSLSRKMSALTSRYNTLIAVEQKQIDRLHAEQASLQ